MKNISLIVICLSLFLLISCGVKEVPLGTEKNPVKMYFVPSMEAGKIITSGEKIAEYLEKDTGIKFEVAVPTSYAAVIEAMGTKEADIAWLATFAYILANAKYNAQVALTTVRYGHKNYRGQFIARADSDLNSLNDIQGKTIAYTDASSTSGYIYPSAVLAQNKIEPGNTLFAGGHPQAVLAVYQERADVGCTYWSPVNDGVPQDARKAVRDTYPDVFEKVKIIGFTDWIPNDTVTFRDQFPQELKDKIVDSLLKFVSSEDGKKTMEELYSINGLERALDSDYDVVRNTLKALGKDVTEFIK